jgi:hypothetical protein
LIFPALVFVPAPAQATASRLAGFRIQEQRLAPGVVRQQLTRDRVPLVVNVARVDPGAPVELRAVLSHGRLGGSKKRNQRTSQMCAALRCFGGGDDPFAQPHASPIRRPFDRRLRDRTDDLDRRGFDQQRLERRA